MKKDSRTSFNSVYHRLDCLDKWFSCIEGKLDPLNESLSKRVETLVSKDERMNGQDGRSDGRNQSQLLNTSVWNRNWTRLSICLRL